MTYIHRKNSIVIASVIAVIAVMSIASLSIDTEETSAHRIVTSISTIQDPYSAQEIADRSLYIIKGTIKELNIVVDEEGKRFGDKPIVFTEAVITVEEELTGKYKEKEIIVRTLGGISDEYETISPMHAKFAQDKRVIIFVGYEPESEMGDNYFVYGNYMGQYLLKNGVAFGADYPEGLAEAEFISNIRR